MYRPGKTKRRTTGMRSTSSKMTMGSEAQLCIILTSLPSGDSYLNSFSYNPSPNDTQAEYTLSAYS